MPTAHTAQTQSYRPPYSIDVVIDIIKQNKLTVYFGE